MKKFAVFGDPIAHSRSPRLHNNAFMKLNIDAFYSRILLNNGLFLKDKFLSLNLDGANITFPLKNEAFKICDTIDEICKKTNSVNTIIKKDKILYGYNTDYFGFLESIKNEKIDNALIFGAGNTTKTIAYALNSKNIKTTIVNRSNKKENFKEFDFFTFDEFDFLNFKTDIIINTTPVGLINNELFFDENKLKNLIKNSKICYDVIYKNTKFLKLAKQYNKKSINGLDMLLYQAVYAFNIFFDNKFKNEEITKYMQEVIDLGQKA